MRAILTFIFCLTVLIPAARGESDAAPAFMEKPSKITVFVAKRIVTMDPAFPVATAVAVADGKILSVGSLAELKPWLSRYPHEVNRRFADKVIYPGFIEAHGHPLLGGLTQSSPALTSFPLPSPWGPTFPGLKNIQAVKAKLKEYSNALKDPNALLLAWGYDIPSMKGQMPDRAFLDEVSTSRPIIVWDSSEHNIFANSVTIKKYGVTPDKIKRLIGAGTDRDGSSNGQFLGAAASEYLINLANKDIMTPERLSRAMLFSNDLAQQGGITTSSDQAFGAIDMATEEEMMKKLTSSSATSLRVVPIAFGPAYINEYGDRAIGKVNDLQKLNTDRLIFKGIKFMADDAFSANTMMVQNPSYTDWHKGISFYPNASLLAQDMKPWWEAGFHIHVHSNGNVGNENTVNALQILQDEKPRFDHRFTLEHFGLSSSMIVRKIKELGAVVSVNPAFFYIRGSLQAADLGFDRVASSTRVGNLVKEGVVVSLHSDSPVAPPQPLTEVWAVVNRRNLFTNQLFAPAEAVTPAQAMKMITIDAAYTVGVEDKVGSIEPGKFADFAVLNEDPQTVPKMKIKDIAVHATVLGGRVIPVTETKKPRAL